MSYDRYFDYAASTPIATEVVTAMTASMTNPQSCGNPHATTHRHGQAAAESVVIAARQVAATLNCLPSEVVWTSGATEANNLALRGVFNAPLNKRRTLITCATEHKSVLATVEALRDASVNVVILPVDCSGQIDLEQLSNALTDDVALLSVMWVNNETGVIQPVKKLAEMAHAAGALFHVDATQAIAKLPVDVQFNSIDMLSLSAHKFYGPKGAGALYIKQTERLKVVAQITGGGQQRDMRSGTLPVHQVVGVGKACELATEHLAADYAHAQLCRQTLLDSLNGLPGVTINGDDTLANIVNLSIADVNGESLQFALQDYSIAAGSACTTDNAEPSYVLKAMGVPRKLAETSLRISFGRQTTIEAVASLAEKLVSSVNHLRQIAGVGVVK